MMELLRQWLTGVTCAAIIVALADSLMAGGTARKIGRLAGGLLLLAAVVKPVLEVDLAALSASVVQLEVESVPAAEEAGLDLMKSIIGEETGAYILDKAAQLDIPCTGVEVLCQTGENGLPYPAEVTVWGVQNQEDQAVLAQMVEGELAIPVQNQTFESEDKE